MNRKPKDDTNSPATTAANSNSDVPREPSDCCRRIWNLILTGRFDCPKCGFPDKETAKKFWEELEGI